MLKNIFDDECLMVLSFVKEATKNFNASYSYKHTYNIALKSIKMLNKKDVFYLALLHDICNHEHSIQRKELTKFINFVIPQYSYIDELIDKVSYTYYIKNKQEKVPRILEIVRDAVRDYKNLGEKE